MDKAREIAIEIIDLFEELLNKHNIQLPSVEREGNEEGACIFGSDYYKLEDEITSILNEKYVEKTEIEEECV